MAKLLVEFWIWWGGKLKLPGGGMLIRVFAKILPRLRAFPFDVRNVGTAYLDFCDKAAFGMVKIFRLNEYDNDRALFKFLETVLRPGAVLWDVGANVGFVSGYFAHPRFQLKSIQAFEPNPRMNAALRKFFEDCNTVTVHGCGLGSMDGAIEMNISASDSLVGSMTRSLADGQKISVAVRRGDSLMSLEQLPAPDVLKIDVEGFEPEVFSGFRETILRKLPIVVFEHIWLSDEQICGLVPTGYKLLFLQDDGSIEGDIAQRRRGHDAILMPAGVTVPRLTL
ncbi:MAG: hypothetical protein JWO95_2872 [Verrucomicrobiales bacterium]|nr:hypothetical protein [Verrucomicrobiales bacterium]